MILIIGGAYQGKREYALQTYGVTQMYTCSVDSSKQPAKTQVVDHFERWILACVQDDPMYEYTILNYLDSLTDEIIICEDISCGLVPIDPVLRQWREMVGKTLATISVRADSVVRLFCGIPTILKGEKNEE